MHEFSNYFTYSNNNSYFCICLSIGKLLLFSIIVKVSFDAEL